MKRSDERKRRRGRKRRAGRHAAPSDKGKATKAEGGPGFAAKRPVLLFVLPVVLLTAAFNAAYYLWLVPSGFFEGYLAVNAELSAVFLNVFGDDALVDGTSLSSSRFSLDIANGCDAIQVAAFYLFLVLASPVAVAWWRKILASVVGILVLGMMNLVRIVSLYYTGVYVRSAFETMHLDVWQPVFIFLSLFLWVFWVWRVKRAPAVAPDATS